VNGGVVGHGNARISAPDVENMVLQIVEQM